MPTIHPNDMFRHADNCLDRAYELLGDAADWLRSDWPPGTVLTEEQARRRTAMFEAISAAKYAINEGKRG